MNQGGSPEAGVSDGDDQTMPPREESAMAGYVRRADERRARSTRPQLGLSGNGIPQPFQRPEQVEREQGRDEHGRADREAVAALDEFLAEPAPEVAPEATVPPTPRPAKSAGTILSGPTVNPGEGELRKFEFEKGLRGRIGDGDGQMSRAEYAALVMLATYASGDLTGASPGHVRLARDLGYSGSDPARVVRELIRSLKRKGYLVQTRGGRNLRGSVSSEYRLKLPEWE